jgi:hypothetical protein
MRLRTIALAAALAALSVSVVAQGPRRDGKWEVKIEMQMSGMPAGVQLPVQTTTQCITPSDAADPSKSVPQAPPGRGGRGGPENCKMENYKAEGNKVSYTMKCDPPNAMTMVGDFTYGTDTYEGTMKADIDRGGQAMAMTMKYTGKRIGDCTK